MNDINLINTAQEYLRLCEERCVTEAAAYLHPKASLVFPGPVHYSSPAEMAGSAMRRYQRVGKNVNDWIAGARTSDGRPVVMSTGTLHGLALDGSEFSGVRYVDVFVFEDGLILEQHVFNDLAESGVVTPEHGDSAATLSEAKKA